MTIIEQSNRPTAPSLERIRERWSGGWSWDPTAQDLNIGRDVKALLAHIDRQAERIAELEGKAEKSQKVWNILSSPLMRNLSLNPKP